MGLLWGGSIFLYGAGRAEAGKYRTLHRLAAHLAAGLVVSNGMGLLLRRMAQRGQRCRQQHALGPGNALRRDCALRALREDAIATLLQSVQGKLIVYCQADPGDAFYGRTELYARAAATAGAAGIRGNGPQDIRGIRDAVSLPIIGIQKRLQPEGKILMTPSFEDA